MDKLVIKNDYSYLLTEDSSLRYKLWDKLRFKTRNFFMHPLYKQRKWDGCISFFDKKTGKFLTGLVTEIRLALHYLDIKYEVIDQRTETKFLHTEINDQFLNQWLPKGMKPIILENYQVDLVNQALKHKCGIVKSPTGTGKTYIMLAIMKCIPPGTPILFLCNRKSLVRQNYKEMINWGFTNVGMYNSDIKEPNIITCANVQSLHHLEPILPKFKVLIVDEVHTMVSKTAIKAYKKLTGCDIKIGVSATPFKYELKKKGKKEVIDGDKVHKYSVKGYFGPVFKTKSVEGGELTIEYMQDIGRLSPSTCCFYNITEPDNIEFDTYQDAVTKGIAQNWFFHKVVQRLTATLEGRTLILVDRLAHGNTLEGLIPGAFWVQGKDDEETRDIVIEKLQKGTGNIVAIATQQIFSTGLNLRLHNIINAAGGAASHEIAQRIGRGLRPADDKSILRYFDFIFKTNRHIKKHSMVRVRVLGDEGHEIIIKEIDF